MNSMLIKNHNINLETLKEKQFLICMVGLPSSGKSTIAEELSKKYNAVIISSDGIRDELDPEKKRDQLNNEKVFSILHNRVRENLNNGNNVIVDATNVTIRNRKCVLNDVRKDKNIYKVAYVCGKRFADCILDNHKREHPVPKIVLDKFIRRFQIPFEGEGWDAIYIHDYKYKFDISRESYYVKQMSDFNQNNPHHKQLLGDHCVSTDARFYDKRPDIYEKFSIGSLLHDIGKLFTKSTDEDGISHYRNHENVSAYILLTQFEMSSLDDVFLANYHMFPFHWKEQKTHDKYKKLFGEFKYQLLIDFNECDTGEPYEPGI